MLVNLKSILSWYVQKSITRLEENSWNQNPEVANEWLVSCECEGESHFLFLYFLDVHSSSHWRAWIPTSWRISVLYHSWQINHVVCIKILVFKSIPWLWCGSERVSHVAGIFFHATLPQRKHDTHYTCSLISFLIFWGYTAHATS